MPKPERIVEKIDKPRDFNKAVKNWKIKARILTDEIKIRKYHQKPSAAKREKINKATYIQKIKDRNQE